MMDLPQQPLSRTSFFEEQARNRRATRWIGLLCVLTMVATAILLSGVLSPVIAAGAVVALRLVGLLLPIPDDVWTVLRQWHQVFARFVEHLYYLEPLRAAEIMSGVVASFVLMLPGILVAVGLWTWLRIALSGDGVGGILMRLGTRDANQGDPEERQLVNVVAEMAIAAGLEPPRVRLTDHPVANAALIGTSERDAVVIISRRVLDELDRRATQGLVGHLIGSLGNGDLRVALLSLSVFQTFGLIVTVLDAPFSPSARAQLRHLVSAIAEHGRGEGGTAAEIASALLVESLDDQRVAEMNRPVDAGAQRGAKSLSSFVRNARQFVLLPVLVTSLFARMVVVLVGQILLGPLIAWAWRTRSLLADATAVQLTRDPDALARALRMLGERGGVLPGGRWAVHLCVIGAEPADAPGRKERASTASTPFGSEAIVQLEFHPPIDQRVERLVAQGAQPSIAVGGRSASVGRARPAGALMRLGFRILLGALVVAYLGFVTMLAFLGFAVGMSFVGEVLVP